MHNNNAVHYSYTLQVIILRWCSFESVNTGAESEMNSILYEKNMIRLTNDIIKQDWPWLVMEVPSRKWCLEWLLTPEHL